MRIQYLIVPFISLTGAVVAEDFIVAAGGGPGVDFVDLPAAVASPLVQDGDRLLVRAGTYSGFGTDKALTIRELGGPAKVAGSASFHDLAPGVWATFEGFRAEGLVVDACAGTLIVDGLLCETVRITDCADVRVHGSKIKAGTGSWDGIDAVIVSGISHVEFTECVVRGGRGEDGELVDAGFGGHGVIVADVASVHVASSDVSGGDGGDQYYPEWGNVAGDGGHGILVESAAQTLVTGLPENVIEGGLGGYDTWGWGYDGYDGYGIWNQGATRSSGATVVDEYNAGTMEHPATADPSMSWQRLAGGKIRVQIHGAVGANVRLHLGNRPVLGTAGFLEKPAMSEATWTSWVGTIGSAGNITHVFQSTLPMRAGDRYLVVLQGSVFAGGETILTNSGTLTRLGQ